MFVYHGTSSYKDMAIPVRHRRTRIDRSGKKYLIFDEISFHATPIYWIALAYTYSVDSFNYNGRDIFYNVSINLYSSRKEIVIHGYLSLEHSLLTLYNNGGYILKFNDTFFHHGEGLGTMECVTKEAIKPLSINYISNPLSMLKKHGVTFTFIDLICPKNRHLRNYLN